MHKKIIIILILIISIYYGYKILSPKNNPIPNTTSLQAHTQQKVVSKAAPSYSKDDGADHLQINYNDIYSMIKNKNTIIQIQNYISNNEAITKNSNHVETLNATLSYLKYRLTALSTTEQSQVVNNYKQAFIALSCAQMFIRQNNQDAYLFFKELNNIILSDEQLKIKQNLIDEQLNGQIFVDLTPDVKSKICNQLFK